MNSQSSILIISGALLATMLSAGVDLIEAQTRSQEQAPNLAHVLEAMRQAEILELSPLQTLAEHGLPVFAILQSELGVEAEQMANLQDARIPGDLAYAALIAGLEKLRDVPESLEALKNPFLDPAFAEQHAEQLNTLSQTPPFDGEAVQDAAAALLVSTEPPASIEVNGTVYHRTGRGLPNTCAGSGAEVGDAWYAEHDDAARAGAGFSLAYLQSQAEAAR